MLVADMGDTVAEVVRFGFGEPVAVSCSMHEGLADLYVALQPRIDAVTAELKEMEGLADEEPAQHKKAGKAQRPSQPAALAAAWSQAELAAAAAAQEADGDSGYDSDALDVDGELADVEGDDMEGGQLEEEDEEEEGEEGEGPKEAVLEGPMKMAIMGVPNSGKSTLLNRIIGEERVLTGAYVYRPAAQPLRPVSPHHCSVAL